MFKVIDNFLSKEEHTSIYNTLSNEYFPWYFNNYKLVPQSNKLFDYQFVHIFYDNEKINSDYFNNLNPLIKKINPKKLKRIKANLNVISQKLIKYNPHCDSHDPDQKSAVYYLNTNNGYTKIKDKKIKSEANKIVFFASNTLHSGTNSTNCNNRMVINITYVL